MVDLIPSPESVMEILKKAGHIVAATLSTQTASMLLTIFKCRLHFAITTMRGFYRSA